MAAPFFSTIQGSIFPDNLAYDNEVVTISIAVENMTGAEDESVYFKILGQNEIYALSHSAGELYTGNVPLSRFTPDNYALCIIVAVNSDGVAFYDDLLASLLASSVNDVVMESFSTSPSDWEGNASHSGADSIGGELVVLDYTGSNQNYYKTLADALDMTGRLYMMFLYRPETVDTDAPTEHNIGFFWDDPYVILGGTRYNRLGFRMVFQDTVPIRVKPYVHVSDYAGTVNEIEMDFSMSTVTGPPEKNWWYLFMLEWVPEETALFATAYNIDLSGDLVLVDRKCLKLDAIPQITLENWGVTNNGINLIPPYDQSRFWINNTYASSGVTLTDYPKIVSELDVDDAYSPTDVQILAHYYDFDTGEDIEADQDMEIEIIDSLGVVQTTLAGLLRDDGWYEAYWDTAAVIKDTYTVKVTAIISGKKAVMEELVSIQ